MSEFRGSGGSDNQKQLSLPLLVPQFKVWQFFSCLRIQRHDELMRLLQVLCVCPKHLEKAENEILRLSHMPLIITLFR